MGVSSLNDRALALSFRGHKADKASQYALTPLNMSDTRLCSVYIVDDNEYVRRFIEDVLSSAGYQFAAFEDGASFLDQVPSLESGVVLLDLRMPGLGGLEVLQRLSPDLDRFAPIMVTAHGDVDIAVQAMKSGARDFLQKPFSEQVLLDMVAKEAERLHALLDRAPASADRLAGMSTRERQVALALSRGLSNKQVAQELNISVRTVEMHRARAMQRLGCRSFAEFLSAVLQSGDSALA